MWAGEDHTELEMGDLLGAGGYGEVYRAMWKGTDVAVKMMTSEVVTKEMQKNFTEEVRIIDTLMSLWFY